MTDGRDNTRGGARPHRQPPVRSDVANQQRLIALGDAVNRRNGITTRAKPRRAHYIRRRVLVGLTAVVVVIAGVIGGSYLYAQYRFDKIHKFNVKGEASLKGLGGQPFNILIIGSDSRAGLSGILAAQTGKTLTPGQRSDVVKIVHVDPIAKTISMVSIPRDTVVSLLANQGLYGSYNRINVNFGNGPSLLVKTIEANFGIPIHQTIVVSFAGLINSADALGGVKLDFPFPSRDPYSDLNIPVAGCQTIEGAEALAVVRSRHMYYNIKGSRYWPKDATGPALLNSTAVDNEVYNAGWRYDGTSDFGRIYRQNAFLRAMVNGARALYNPLKINSFLSKLPQGISLDNTFSLSELVKLAVTFHNINANSIRTYTIPTLAIDNNNLGDVLFVSQPAAQQMFTGIFGNELYEPTNPPPNQALRTPEPTLIHVTTTTTSSTTTTAKKKKHHGTTTTTTTTINPTLDAPSYDPRPC